MLIGVGLAFVLVSAVLAVQAVASLFGFGQDADVEKLTEQLLGPLFSSPLGILTLGLSAALGEETLMRGAAQPRLGLIYTSFLFALLHSNYGITLSTWVVFGVGIVLGLVRIRFNTSTAMVVHATYNMLLGMMAALGMEFMQGGR
jgi:membrane protease YdiL (CAAX protease family)